MLRKYQKYFDYLAWIVLGGILLWLILKVTGVINTPLIVEYSPIFGAVYLAGWGMSKLNYVAGDLKDFKKETRDEFQKVKEEFKIVHKEISEIKLDVNKIKAVCPNC